MATPNIADALILLPVTGGSILWYIQKEPDLAIKLLFNRGWWYF
jgi:hypothetical protein